MSPATWTILGLGNFVWDAIDTIESRGGVVERVVVNMAVAFLFSFFSKLLVAASVSAQSEAQLVTALKISPYNAKDYMNALRKYSLERIIQNISLLKETDLRLKGVNSGSEDEAQILKELVVRLIH